MKRKKPLGRGAPLRRRTPLERGPGPERRTPIKPKVHRLARRPLRPVGRRRERDRATGRVFGPLADLARAQGCQAAAWAPGPCRGKIDACHVRTRNAGGGDWTLRPMPGADGPEVVGNVFGACRRHHEYSDHHKAECSEAMIRAALTNGRQAIEAGIIPVL